MNGNGLAFQDASGWSPARRRAFEHNCTMLQQLEPGRKAVVILHVPETDDLRDVQVIASIGDKPTLERLIKSLERWGDLMRREFEGRAKQLWTP